MSRMKLIRKVMLAFLCVLFLSIATNAQLDSAKAKIENVSNAEKLIGLDFSNSEKDSMLDGLTDQLKLYRELRTVNIENWIPPALQFNPIPLGHEARYASASNHLQQTGQCDSSKESTRIGVLFCWGSR